MSTKAADWESAKSDYKALTGAKKPREKVVGLLKTGHTGLSKSIAILDECDGPGSKRSPDDMVKELAKFKKSVDGYLDTLSAAMAKEPLTDTGEKNAMGLALKALKTRLKSYVAFFEMSLATRQSVQAGASAKKQLADTAAKRIAVGCAAAAASIAKINASRTAESWNKEMNGTSGGPRVLTTSLKLFKQIDKTDTRADAYISALSPYADGDFAKMDPNTPSDEIVAHLSKLATLLKAVKKDFANV